MDARDQVIASLEAQFLREMDELRQDNAYLQAELSLVQRNLDGYIRRDTAGEPVMPRFEYLRMTDLKPEQEELNRLGAQGWELVSVTCSVVAGYSGHWWYYFKRPLQERP